MRIGGFEKFSLVDYPGKVSAVVFTQGCNFRCGYCHNPQLVYPELYTDLISSEEIVEFLEKRIGRIDGVVITGGEPSLQKNLISFMNRIKAMGFLVKLDTNGNKPEVIEEVIASGLADYIAMDIKGPFTKYSKICAVEVDITDIKKSIYLIKNSGIRYQFRTTFDTGLLNNFDLEEVCSYLNNPGSLVVQDCIKRKIKV
jgi:pyruvate formate lyase activating enzyme